MMICPQCTVKLGSDLTLCTACDWQHNLTGRSPTFFTRDDYADPVLGEFLKNYDQIAADDNEQSILDVNYIECQAKNLADLIDDIPNQKICDLGIGKGFLLKELKARGAKNLTAVDIASEYLDLFSDDPEIRTIRANAENLPFENEFDVITATDILEHVLNVGSFLYSLNRALKVGGKAYVRAPFRENLLHYTPHLGCKYRFVHLRTFDKRIIKDSFEMAGFKTKKIAKDGLVFYLAHPFWRLNFVTKAFFMLFRGFMHWRLKRKGLSDAFLTCSKSRFIRLFLRPAEIIIVVEKMKNIVPNKNKIFDLVP